jgi:hypothetical protein
VKGRGPIIAVAVLSIATVAVGLRVGAGSSVRAAIVLGAPVSHGHASWQLRVQDEDLMRTAALVPFTMTVRAHDVESTLRGETNAEGVAEVGFDRPGFANGDHVDLVVADDKGRDLARGTATWPPDVSQLHARLYEHAALRPSRADGKLRMRVAVFGGALAPGQPGRVWVTVSSATAEPPLNPRIEATPDLGLEVDAPYAPSHDATCVRAGVIAVTARGHIGGLALHAKDDLGREGDWYGALPIAPGAMHVAMPTVVEHGPVRATITSANAFTLAYVEVDDAQGRADARMLKLSGEPPRAELTLDLRDVGRSFVVVAGGPDGATSIAGATRAIPVWVGPSPPCEAELAETTALAFPRFTALDGFAAKHHTLAVKRKRGRLIALGALGLGSLLETLLLLRAAREGRRAPTAPKRTALDVLVVLMLSLLGFVLLFALVEWTSR